jgi:hypothetical protein
MGGSGMMIPSALAGVVGIKANASAKRKAKQERVIHLDMGFSDLFFSTWISGRCGAFHELCPMLAAKTHASAR